MPFTFTTLPILHAAAVALLLLAWTLSPPPAGAEEPTGTIPSMRASVVGLRFLPGDRAPAPPGQREYDHPFLHTSARFIH